MNKNSPRVLGSVAVKSGARALQKSGSGLKKVSAKRDYGEDQLTGEQTEEEQHQAAQDWSENQYLRRQQDMMDLHQSSQKSRKKQGHIHWKEMDNPTKLIKNRCVLKATVFEEFELHFTVKLQGIQPTRRSILQMSVNGVESSEAPHIFVEAETTQLVAVYSHGSVRKIVYGDMDGIPLDKEVQVSFKLYAGTMTLEYGNHTADQGIDEDQIARAGKFHVFLSGPLYDPADAIVSQMFYRKLSIGYSKAKGRVANFDLPAREKQQLDEARKEILRNKRWAAFDMFFGSILVANSLVVGMQVQEPKHAWFAINVIFVILFLFELTLRIIMMCRPPGPKDGEATLPEYDMMHGKSICGKSRVVFTDSWLVFDVFAISISILDLYLDSKGTDLPFNMTLVRLVRLLRLAKMVRLLRAFRELGMLVEGVIQSMQTLFWTFILLLLVTYVMAIIIVKTTHWATRAHDADADIKSKDPHDGDLIFEKYSTVTNAMWEMCSLATYSNWTETIKAAFLQGNLEGFFLGCFLSLFVVITAVGILNMVVGVLCHTAFGLDEKLRRMQNAEELLRRGFQLKELRMRLKSYGQRPLFKSDQMLDNYELLEAVQKDAGIAAICEDLEISTKDIVQLITAFAESDQLEIEGVIEAMGTIELQRYFSNIAVGQVIEASRGSMRPVDMVFFSFCNKELESLVSIAEGNSLSICTLAYDAIANLNERAQQAFTMLSPHGSSGCRCQVPDRKLKSHEGITIDHYAKHSMQTNAATAEANLSMPLDVFFGFFIFLNGILIGVETAYPGPNPVYVVLGAFFALLFLGEFCLRAVLFANIAALRAASRKLVSAGNPAGSKMDGSGNADSIMTGEMMERALDLKKRMKYHGIVSPMPERGTMEVVLGVPSMLKQLPALFDFIIVVVCLLDVTLSNMTTAVGNISALATIRIFRLLRLARLLKTAHMFPKLQMLMASMTSASKNLLMIIVNLMIALYSFSIFMVSHVGADVDEHHDLAVYFKSITSAALSGWQAVSFDDWAKIVNLLLDDDRTLPAMLMLVMMFVLGLGLLKMAIGVMCGCAINLQRKRDKDSAREDLQRLIAGMVEMQTLCDNTLGSRVIPQEIFEKAVGMRFRPRRGMVSSSSGAKNVATDEADSSRDIPTEHLRRMKTVGMGLKFQEEFWRILHLECKLNPSIVRQVYEQVDFLKSGYVTVDGFLRGALVLKEDLTKIDIFASSVGLRAARDKFKEGKDLLIQVHNHMETLVEDMHTLIHRKQQVDHNKIPEDKFKKEENKSVEDLHLLRKSAMDALEQLQRLDANGMPEIGKGGTSTVNRGTGKILFDDATASFKGVGDIETCFRSQIMQGDILIWQSGDHSFQAAVVATVSANDRLKVHNMADAKLGDAKHTPVSFLVSRSTENKVFIQTSTGDLAPSHELEETFTPRSAQLMLDWQIATRERETTQLDKLRQERQLLQLQVMDLEKELKTIANRSLVLEIIGMWRKCVADHAEQKSLMEKTKSLAHDAIRSASKSPR